VTAPHVWPIPGSTFTSRAAERDGKKGGVVLDKPVTPSLQKLRKLYEAQSRSCQSASILGWQIFDGALFPAQPPSWNYRNATCGGLILDMYALWRYIFDHLLGPITAVSARQSG
jgi:predicted dehydrogenase